MQNLSFSLTTIMNSEAVVQRCSVKKALLEISQNSQKNTCARVPFSTKRPATLLKKRLWHRCFSVNSVKFLRTPFYIEHLWWLHKHTNVEFYIATVPASCRALQQQLKYGSHLAITNDNLRQRARDNQLQIGPKQLCTFILEQSSTSV